MEELISFGIRYESLNLTSYFGDVYLPYRTVMLAILIFAGLRIRKVIKARKAGN